MNQQAVPPESHGGLTCHDTPSTGHDCGHISSFTRHFAAEQMKLLGTAPEIESLLIVDHTANLTGQSEHIDKEARRADAVDTHFPHIIWPDIVPFW